VAVRRKGIRKPDRAAARAAPEPAPSALLQALKRAAPLTIRDLAARLGITYEAVRQQIAELLRAGWVVATGAAGPGAVPRSTAAGAPRAGASARPRAPAARPGPASQAYRLSAAAEHLFPKHYDELSAELVRHVIESFGGAGVVEILRRMTDARVLRWAPLLAGLTLRGKLEALSSLYEDKDAYMQLEWRPEGPALIEHNCPFFSVAQQHPAICSVSVNTLERLLGYKVVREQRFQAGHGRCVFRVKLEESRTADQAFTLETQK
jgi:predicted ArsR family transcriptional regulator